MKRLIAVIGHIAAAMALAAATPLGADTLSAADAYALPQPVPDLVVRYGDEARQFGELRLPDGEGPFPVVVVVHGGCWLEDYDHSYMAGLAEAISEEGLAVWTIGYRRVGEEGGGWPHTFLDAGAAVDFLPELAKYHPLDTSRVVAVGHSAGGQLALWLAGRHNLPPESRLHTNHSQPIHAVLALAAAADLAFLSAQGSCGNAANRLLGGPPEEFPARYAQASPERLLPLGVPQILINGELDNTWSTPAENYHAAAQAAGDEAQLRVMPNAGHFELVAPNSPKWPMVTDALSDLMEALNEH